MSTTPSVQTLPHQTTELSTLLINVAEAARLVAAAKELADAERALKRPQKHRQIFVWRILPVNSSATIFVHFIYGRRYPVFGKMNNEIHITNHGSDC